jgi:signal transduction histidine kinase
LKLKHSVGLLLALPLISQLAFAGALVYQVLDIQGAAERETKAKKIVTACQDMRDQMSRYILLLTARRYTDQQQSRVLAEKISGKVRAGLDNIESLMASDVEGRGLLKTYHEHLQRFSTLLSAYTGGYSAGRDKLYLSRFLHESEYFEELMDSFLNIVEDERKITARYKPVAEQLQPAAIGARERMLAILITAIIFNSVLVVVLGMMFSRNTVARLLQLMRNVHNFGRGESSTLTPVPGDDEITELDSEFRRIAQSKIESDQLRRAMYGMVSHDLRSPLTAVGLKLDMLLENPSLPLDAAVRRAIERSSSELQRLIRLASSFLDGQKLEAGQLELHIKFADATEVVARSISAVEGSAEFKKITLLRNIACQRPMECDFDRVVQVLVNLLSNAVKYAPANSEVTVQVTCTETHVRFDVIDQGPSIPEAERARLFQPFSQLKQEDGTLEQLGTGLGLYLCRLLVEAHCGEIGYEDLPDQGKSFWFVIPQPEFAQDQPVL